MSPYESIKSLERDLPLATGVQTQIIVDNADVCKDMRFTFIEDHLRYAAFELIKNAVLSALAKGMEEQARRVKVTIADSPQAICVRVSDECEIVAPRLSKQC
jgi:hypothetical protein